MSAHGAEQSTDAANSAALGTAKKVQDDVKQVSSTSSQAIAVGPESQALNQSTDAIN